MRPRLSFLASFALVLVIAAGCKKKPPPGPAARQSAAASALASAVAAPSASVAEAPGAAVEDAAAPSERSIAAGSTPTGFHVGAFDLKTLDDAGLAFEKAVDACALAGKFLCSEFEWQRACAETPELGKTETWTYSAERDRAIVRGGDTCEKRAAVNPSDASGARATLCCGRAVGVIGGFGDAAEKIGAALVVYERGLRDNKPEDVAAVTLETLVFAGKELKRDELLPAALQALLPDASKELVLFDSCVLKPSAEDAGATTNLECTAARLRANGPEELRWKLTTTGPEHRLSRIDLPLPPSQGEQKQRVGGFLPSTR